MRHAIGLVLLGSCGAPELSEITEQLCARCDETCAFDEPTSASRSHVTGGVDYRDTPPASGDHDPCWADWGIHDEDRGAEHWVHNLEHGGVVYLYNCPAGCEAQVAELEELVGSLPEGTVILAPYAQMDTRFAALAWERRLVVDCFRVEAFEDFYELFADNAPESLTSAPPGGCMETDTTSG